MRSSDATRTDARDAGGSTIGATGGACCGAFTTGPRAVRVVVGKSHGSVTSRTGSSSAATAPSGATRTSRSSASIHVSSGSSSPESASANHTRYRSGTPFTGGAGSRRKEATSHAIRPTPELRARVARGTTAHTRGALSLRNRVRRTRPSKPRRTLQRSAQHPRT